MSASSHTRGHRYDVNTNTNYNSAAETEAGLYGMRAIARYLGEELRLSEPSPSRSKIAA